MFTILDFLQLSDTALSILVLALTVVTGLLLGRLKIGKVSLGISGVLFCGLFLSYMGLELPHEIQHFVKELGLILFVFSIGLQIGPGFFSSLKRSGLSTNLLAGGVVLLGFGIAVAIFYLFDIEVSVLAGILTGAVTNTPSLGAAQQFLLDQGATGAAADAGAGYAVAYPFGIIGIILSMILIRAFFGIKVDQEVSSYRKEQQQDEQIPETLSMAIKNPLLIGQPYSALSELVEGNIVMSRLLRGEEELVPKLETVIEENDEVQVVVAPQYVQRLRLMVGDVAQRDLRKVGGMLAMRHVLVTRPDVGGKTIQELNILGRYRANITRIFRAGLQFIPQLNTSVEIGDEVRVVGNTEDLEKISAELGDSPDQLNIPNGLGLFLGILVGVLIGSIPIFVPGLPAAVKLGLAGGPLLVAILLSRLGHSAICGVSDLMGG